MNLRFPTPADAPDVWRLVRDAGTLDLNSVYAYAITFAHFPRSCVVAVDGDAVVGVVTGYRPTPDVHFVWQVGVHADHRGRGLATRMLLWLLDGARGVRFVHTTVTPSNTASRHLFRGLATRLHTNLQIGDGIAAAALGHGHEREDLLRIGPLSQETP